VVLRRSRRHPVPGAHVMAAVLVVVIHLVVVPFGIVCCEVCGFHRDSPKGRAWKVLGRHPLLTVVGPARMLHAE